MDDSPCTRGALRLARILPLRGLAALAVAALAACGDQANPAAPEAAVAPRPPASQPRPSASVADGEPLDVIDALERIAPAFGSTGPGNQLRLALGQLAAVARGGDIGATRREGVLVTLALDRLESLGDPSLRPELDAVRLVVDARR